MSDFSISLIPNISEYPNREAKAAEIHAWLVAEAIIEPEASGCILSNELGYSVGSQAAKVVSEPTFLPNNLTVNGLEISTRRTVFSAELEELTCPNCKNDIAADDWDLTPWFEQASDGLICPQCAKEAAIHSYTFRPAWGFSNLGFSFWNWPRLTQDFIKQFEARLGYPISIVHQHI